MARGIIKILRAMAYFFQERADMIVTIKRSGGYAGIAETVCHLDTETMSPALAKRLVKLIEASNFFALAAETPDDEVGADMFRYEITVEEGDRTHTVGFTAGEGKPTTPIRRLLASLLNLTGK
jgi:hypothetical protein